MTFSLDLPLLSTVVISEYCFSAATTISISSLPGFELSRDLPQLSALGFMGNNFNNMDILLLNSRSE